MANASTGVSVYNGTWCKVGGTSVGAPAWAGIYALTLSATNQNLYGKAELDYAGFFRDITVGGNNFESAGVGYDHVTGLGSPLTYGFSTVTVNPTEGPAGTAITFEGSSIIGDSVNISYFNPITSKWIPLVDNLATTAQSFTYTTNAPDLLANNIAGDNLPLSDNIVFCAQDNSNGLNYTTAVPYTEMRRGLTQVGDVSAQGVFGNNTDLSATFWFDPATL